MVRRALGRQSTVRPAAGCRQWSGLHVRTWTDGTGAPRESMPIVGAGTGHGFRPRRYLGSGPPAARTPVPALPFAGHRDEPVPHGSGPRTHRSFRTPVSNPPNPAPASRAPSRHGRDGGSGCCSPDTALKSRPSGRWHNRRCGHRMPVPQTSRYRCAARSSLSVRYRIAQPPEQDDPIRGTLRSECLANRQFPGERRPWVSTELPVRLGGLRDRW